MRSARRHHDSCARPTLARSRRRPSPPVAGGSLTRASSRRLSTRYIEAIVSTAFAARTHVTDPVSDDRDRNRKSRDADGLPPPQAASPRSARVDVSARIVEPAEDKKAADMCCLDPDRAHDVADASSSAGRLERQLGAIADGSSRGCGPRSAGRRPGRTPTSHCVCARFRSVVVHTLQQPPERDYSLARTLAEASPSCGCKTAVWRSPVVRGGRYRRVCRGLGGPKSGPEVDRTTPGPRSGHRRCPAFEALPKCGAAHHDAVRPTFAVLIGASGSASASRRVAGRHSYTSTRT